MKKKRKNMCQEQALDCIRVYTTLLRAMKVRGFCCTHREIEGVHIVGLLSPCTYTTRAAKLQDAALRRTALNLQVAKPLIRTREGSATTAVSVEMLLNKGSARHSNVTQQGT